MLGLAVSVLTVPRLLINYGMDGDAIRSMVVARHLVETGIYVPSRLPGNPLYEYVLALVSLADGHVLSNLIALASFGLCIGAFHLIVRDRNHGVILTALFALTPILLLNAASTMDYLPGLAMILMSYVCARRESYVPGFLLAGLSIGLRLSNSLFLVPLSLFLLFRGVSTGRIVLYGLFGLVTGLVFYAPIVMEFGLHWLSIPPHAYHGFSYVLFAGYKFITVFGPLATAALVVMVLLNIRKIVGLTTHELRDENPDYVLELTSVLLFLALFIVHADESEYLIPAIPFGYLLAARWFEKRTLIVFSVLVISFAFVSVEFKGGESGRRRLAASLQPGILIRDFSDRRHLEVLRREISRFDKSDKAVILDGYGPVLGFDNPGLVKADYREISPNLSEAGIAERSFVYKLPSTDVYLVHGMSKENVGILRREGYRVYCFSESAPSHLMHSWGYKPSDIGLIRLDIRGEKAFYRHRK